MVQSITPGPTPGMIQLQLKRKIIDKLGEISNSDEIACLREMAGFGPETLKYIEDYGFYDSPEDFINSMKDLRDNIIVTN